MNDFYSIKGALDAHKQLAFPKHADADDLEEILMELLELDGHIVGVAVSLLNSAKLESKVLPELTPLFHRLDRCVATGSDISVKQAACEYLESLGLIVELLRRGPQQ